MVSSAIYGAAAGTGLALVVAMTIVVYRYYAVKRKGKYWSNLDRWPDPPGTKRPEERQKDCSEHCHDASSSHVLNCWRKEQKNYYAVQNRVSTMYVSSTSLCLLLGIKLQNPRNTGESGKWMEWSWCSFLTNIVLYILSIRLLNSRFEFDWYSIFIIIWEFSRYLVFARSEIFDETFRFVYWARIIFLVQNNWLVPKFLIQILLFFPNFVGLIICWYILDINSVVLK